MAQAIRLASRSVPNEPALPGEDPLASRSILLFEQATQGCRMDEEKAATLYELVHKELLEEEGV